jgi:DNA-binding XRE family transcriptional regulator
LIRKAENLTQSEFAAKFGVAKSTYANYETGFSNPDFLFLQQVSDKYGVTADQLLYSQLSAESIKKTAESTSKSTPNSTPKAQKYPTRSGAGMTLNEGRAPYGKTCQECAGKDKIIASQEKTIKALESALNIAEARLSDLEKAQKKGQ